MVWDLRSRNCAGTNGSVEKEISVQSAGLAARHVSLHTPTHPCCFYGAHRCSTSPLSMYIIMADCAPVAGSSCNQLSRRPLSSALLHPFATCHWNAAPVDRVPRRAPIVMHCCAQVSMALWPSSLSPAAGLDTVGAARRVGF